ncbi:hypothetical protein [Burkholderia multivorans]|uniref:hypothetical protein n=1 Tax=Burkholderia multivorans TaxID=87883 RepID=UPI001C22C4C0|nr:hypothetical protein [Burkholderia multivorans]MBU9210929.1 hypothetical protein [Burkholderia multivorans]
MRSDQIHRARAFAAWLVNLAALSAGLAVLWKGILFLRGDASSWLVLALNSHGNMRLVASLGDPDSSLLGFLLYYVYGMFGYVLVMGCVLLAGIAGARVALVGFTQFRRELQLKWRERKPL